MLENKINEQKKALDSWINNNYLGTVNAVTGFGKCKVGIDAIDYLLSKYDYHSNISILIVVPTTHIKNEWLKEIKKWKKLKILNHLTIECINSVYKFKGKKFSLGIFDEVHNYFGGEYSKLFLNNYFKRKLCLSASIPSIHYYSLIHVLKCPIIYTMNVQKALKLELVNKFSVYNIGIELTEHERVLYNDLTKEIDIASAKGVRLWSLINKRKELVYNATNKFNFLKKNNHLFKDYGLIFSQSKESAEKVLNFIDDCLVHHSGYSKKKRDENVKLFSDGRTKNKILSTAMTLDEGANLPRLSFAILLSSSSKEKQFVQRIGRVIRLEEGKKPSTIIRLYCKNTVEENWINSSQKKVKNIFIKETKIQEIWK